MTDHPQTVTGIRVRAIRPAEDRRAEKRPEKSYGLGDILSGELIVPEASSLRALPRGVTSR